VTPTRGSSFSKLSGMEWKLLITRGETMNFDLKQAMAWEDPERAGLAEDIVAMANVQNGGILLIGVAEGDDGAARIDGLTPEQAASFDLTKVCDYVAGYFQPPVHIRIERPVLDGKQLVAIIVETFDATPIICIKDGPEKRGGASRGKRVFYAGNLIVRTPAAKSEAIRTAEDMHALMRLAVTKTSDKLLTDVRRIIEGVPPAQTPADPYDGALTMWREALAERQAAWRQRYPEYSTFSLLFLPNHSTDKQLDHAEMRKLVQQCQVEALGLTLPNCWENNTTSIQNRPRGIEGKLDLDHYQEFWQLHDTGAFMDASLLHYVGDSVLSFETIIWLVALGIKFAQRLYVNLDVEQFSYEFKLENVKDQSLGTMNPSRVHVRGESRTAEHSIVAGGACTVLDLRSGWRAVVYAVIRQMFALFNLDMAQSTIDGWLDKLGR
jgi:hypothetical protein